MIGIIDIGSNSVRLMLNGKKYVQTTQLSEGLYLGHSLSGAAMERTAKAVIEAYNFAREQGAEVYAFATEAVRFAQNAQIFISILKEQNITVDVLPKETEAKIGFLGAYTSGEIGVLDIGGASAELAVGNEKGLKYSFSLPLGCVRLKEYESDNFNRLYSFVAKEVIKYGLVPSFEKLLTIGGTTSTIAAIFLKMQVYDTNRVHNFILKREDIETTVKMIFDTPPSKRGEIIGLSEKRAQVIAPGGTLLLAVMDYLNLKEVTVSEADNLEGYAKLKKLY